jgi:hypothetical protein
MRNIDKLKNVLKELATEIRVAKQERKSVHFKGERTIKSTNQWMSDAECAYHRVIALKDEIRHYHVAYCMLRGKELEQIEPNTKPSDMKDGLSMNRVERIMDEYAWSEAETEAYLERQAKRKALEVA